MRRTPIALALATLAALALGGCQRGSGDGEASERAVEAAGGSVPTMTRTPTDATSTGAAGAVTGQEDPNPTGAGATTGATPNDPSGSMGATSPTPSPAPTSPPEPDQAIPPR